jgi:hypothetical protein
VPDGRLVYATEPVIWGLAFGLAIALGVFTLYRKRWGWTTWVPLGRSLWARFCYTPIPR